MIDAMQMRVDNRQTGYADLICAHDIHDLASHLGIQRCCAGVRRAEHDSNTKIFDALMALRYLAGALPRR
jgi:hypothetical protein